VGFFHNRGKTKITRLGEEEAEQGFKHFPLPLSLVRDISALNKFSYTNFKPKLLSFSHFVPIFFVRLLSICFKHLAALNPLILIICW
jgi:hypothetical protein